MNHRTRRSGFTLVEMIIYLALFSLTVGGLLTTTYGIVDGSGRLQSKIVVREEGAFILRKVNWALTGATAATVLSPNTLQITKPSLPPAENPLVFTLTAGTVTLARGGGSPASLNSASIPATSLVFTAIPAAGGKPAGVEVRFSLANVSASGTFDVVTYLRS